jgi:hypothetical protein
MICVNQTSDSDEVDIRVQRQNRGRVLLPKAASQISHRLPNSQHHPGSNPTYNK